MKGIVVLLHISAPVFLFECFNADVKQTKYVFCTPYATVYRSKYVARGIFHYCSASFFPPLNDRDL